MISPGIILREMLDDATRLWLEASIEDSLPIPEPVRSEDYSGKFLVRVPRTLHRDLARRAELEGVSLNQLVLSVLSRSIGLVK
jgi:antitoxin HicB